MHTLKSRMMVMAGLVLWGVVAPAAESDRLVDLLVRKGILDAKEAAGIRMELAAPEPKGPTPADAMGKSTTRLQLGMRVQAQFAALNTEIENAPDPAATQHAFLRRVYLQMRAGLGPAWSVNLAYDLADVGFDDAALQYRNGDHAFEFGLRKVNTAFEERRTSSDIRAIERSPATRYFVEPNNGRRLGAAGHRVGAFYDGKHGNLVYSVAITNPERTVDYSTATSAGNGSNNQVALWANVGLAGKLAHGTYFLGTGAGFLPDQGGFGVAGTGNGHDLSIYSLHAEISSGPWQFLGELLHAEVERGVSATRDAAPTGGFVLVGFKFTPAFEGVARYSFVDSDGRGVNLSDGVRSAPSGGTMDRLSELFVGGNWYVKGNDVKFQLGVISARTSDTLTGAPAEAKTTGLRSQLQVNF